MERDWTEFVDLACQGEIRVVRDRVATVIETPGAPADELRGILAYRSGDDGNARKWLSTAVADGAISSKSLLFLLRVQYREGAADEALKTAHQLLGREPDDPDALQTIARIHNQRGEWHEADRRWRSLSDVVPDHPEANKQVVRIAARHRVWDTVVVYAERHLRYDPGSAEVLEALLGARFRQRRLEGVREALIAFHAVEPLKARTLLDRLDRPDEILVCAEVLRHLIADAPADAPLRDLAALKSEAWLQCGLRQELARAVEEAAASYRAVRTVRPADRVAGDGLARLRHASTATMRQARREGADATAADAAEAVLRIDPGFAEAAGVLGRIRMTEARDAVAVALFRDAVAAEPASARLMFDLARAEERAGDPIAALAWFRRVVETEPADAPRSSEAMRARVRLAGRLLERGHAARAGGRLDEAWTYDKAVADSGVHDLTQRAKTELRLVLKSALQNLRIKSKTPDRDALAAAEAYLAKDGDNVQALRIYGRLLNNAKLPGQALPVWEKLGALEPGDPLHALQAARCCMKLKLFDKGVAEAQRALRLSPGHAEAAQILQQLSGCRAAA